MNQFSRIARRMVVVLGLVAASGGAWAQVGNSSTANGTATATVILPITLAASRALAFGNVVPGSTPGTVIVDDSTAGASSVTGGTTQPGSHRGTVSSAQFDVSGEGSFTYTLTMPIGPITITNTTADTMTVDTWTSSIATTAGAGALSGSAGGPGTQTIYVGGTLNVAASQAPGNYSGTFSVTVAYN